MDYITTTELRTKSAHLVRNLLQGKSTDLIHRSRIVGEINPKSTTAKILTPKDTKKLREIFNSLAPKQKLSLKQRRAIYQQHLEEKYGQSVSRR